MIEYTFPYFHPLSFQTKAILNEVCHIATLAQLYVMVGRLSNGFVDAYFWVFMHKICYQFMHKCTHPYPPLKHLKYPEHWHTAIFGSLVTITYGCVTVAINFLRNSKLGVWPPDLPDLANLNCAIMSLFKHPPTHTHRQTLTFRMGNACMHALLNAHCTYTKNS